jgi:TRAP-type C4-dicarboxylate transport system permease small subunit
MNRRTDSLLVRIARTYFTLLEGLAIIAITVMTLVAGLQVFYRYVLADSLFWSEELMRYLMVWTAFLCAGLAYSRGEMLGMRFAVDACPPALRRLIDGLGRAAAVVMLGVVAWYGGQFAWRTAEEEAVALQVSMLWIHAAVPLGAALLALHVLFTGFFRSVLKSHHVAEPPHPVG